MISNLNFIVENDEKKRGVRISKNLFNGRNNIDKNDKIIFIDVVPAIK